jgi:hypothetical protein
VARKPQTGKQPTREEMEATGQERQRAIDEVSADRRRVGGAAGHRMANSASDLCVGKI